MATPRHSSAAGGLGCFFIGVLAALSGGGSVEHVITLDYALIVVGAIIISGVLICSAIAGGGGKG